MFGRRKAKQLKELQARMANIEHICERLDKNLQYSVKIDHLHAHNPVLEQLTFRLDQLDIKTVSGALNLGNNFGVRIIQDTEQSDSEDSESPAEDEAAGKNESTISGDKQGVKQSSSLKSDGVHGGRMEETGQGYRFTFGSRHNKPGE